MLAAALVRFPALRDLRVQFAALACVTALPFVAGAAYDIWFALQTSAGSLLTGPRSDVIEVRVGGLAIALIVSGLLAGLILYRMMPSPGAVDGRRPGARSSDASVELPQHIVHLAAEASQFVAMGHRQLLDHAGSGGREVDLVPALIVLGVVLMVRRIRRGRGVAV